MKKVKVEELGMLPKNPKRNGAVVEIRTKCSYLLHSLSLEREESSFGEVGIWSQSV